MGDDSRLASLDALRGFAIASMMLVNNPGDWKHLHAPLAHAPWNGWTFTDLVFPFFLFASGVAMKLSIDRHAGEGTPRPQLLASAVRRALVIFLIGVALNFVPSFDPAARDHVQRRVPLPPGLVYVPVLVPTPAWLDSKKSSKPLSLASANAGVSKSIDPLATTSSINVSYKMKPL